MKYAMTSKSMREIDNYTINVTGIPALVLMERAAVEIVRVIKKHIRETDRILVVSGPGNNGGDGIAAGRILYQQGYQVAILLLIDDKNISEQLQAQLNIARNIGVTFENYNKLHEYNIIIDGIFGVGLSKPITGEYEKIIEIINNSGSKVFSVDIPSGISADTGKPMNVAVKAEETITFGYMKPGMLVYPGADYCGNITVVDIGFDNKALEKVECNTFYYEKEDLGRLPIRKANSHKGTYGKVLIIAGSSGMGGAAFLSAKAAYRSGAGLVKILSSADNREIIQALLPEAIFEPYDTIAAENNNGIIASLKWASTVVIGPGLSCSEISDKVLRLVLQNCQVPLVIDADAINLLADYISKASVDFKDSEGNVSDSQARLNCLAKRLKPDTVLTPHLMELSRIMGNTASAIENNIIDITSQCSYNNELIYVIKNARTIVTRNNKKYINLSGNNGMATGGSGDVLSGLIAGLIAQGMKPYEASCLAVFIHGLAGDAAASVKGPYSLMAQDILENILT